MTDRLDTTRELLQQHDQEHLLSFVSSLTPEQTDALLDQIASFDFEEIDRLINRYVLNHEPEPVPEHIEPAPIHPRDGGDQFDVDAMRAAGEELIRAGRVAAFTVAGGQGTRLGWNGPKGTFPATPVSGKPLFRVFAEQIRAAEIRYGTVIPWYIMTSPMNDAETRSFFADNNNFGMQRTNILMFPQGTMPSFDRSTGRMMLDRPDHVAVNPDGHGGSMRALRESGALDDMKARGVEQISYFQVDNPLARVIDPLFLGLHAGADSSSGQFSSKMVPKAHAGEKVGVFCRVDGRTAVVEYSDLPEDLAAATDDQGRLRFLAGSIAIHAMSVDFVAQLTDDPARFGLPWHRAEKKVPYIDLGSGERVNPESPNAVKLETFVFDAIPLADSSIVFETTRAEEFAPIKNASGDDSAATSAALQSDLHGGWLEQRGVTVPRDASGRIDASVEISPLTAIDAASIPADELPSSIERGSSLAI